MVPAHLVKLIKSFYVENSVVIKMNGHLSNEFKAQKGVPQGFVLSPVRFNTYGEYIMRKALENYEDGIKIGEELINNIRFVDDKVNSNQRRRNVETI